MGSPISPLIANLFMEEFKVKALNSTPHPPLIAKVHRWHFCHPGGRMQPTTTTGPNNTLTTWVYRRPTHIDQYLHWDSKHFIMAKHSAFNALTHRAKVVSTNQQSLHKELEYIREAQQACSFPPWALDNLQYKSNWKHNIHHGQNYADNQPNNNKNNNRGTNNSNNNNKNISIVIPYIQGLGERFKRTCNSRGIQVHFKGTNTIKTLLMASNGYQKGQQITKEWSNLQIQIPTYKLSGRIYKRIWENFRGQTQETS